MQFKLNAKKGKKRLPIQHKKRGKKRKKSRGAQTLMSACSIPPHLWRRSASNEYVGGTVDRSVGAALWKGKLMKNFIS